MLCTVQCCGTVTIFYGSGSDIWKVMVPVPVPTFEKVMVPVPVPVPTFEKLRFRFRFHLHIYAIKTKFFFINLFPLYIVAVLQGKRFKYQQIYCKMWKKKKLNEGDQIHDFISSSGSGTEIYYGSGSDFLTSYGSVSTRQKVTVPTVPVLVPIPVPVPQHWYLDFGFSCIYISAIRINIIT
jgi:hypothetical protein